MWHHGTFQILSRSLKSFSFRFKTWQGTHSCDQNIQPVILYPALTETKQREPRIASAFIALDSFFGASMFWHCLLFYPLARGKICKHTGWLQDYNSSEDKRCLWCKNTDLSLRKLTTSFDYNGKDSFCLFLLKELKILQILAGSFSPLCHFIFSFSLDSDVLIKFY